jgi:hypothetical protein
MRPPHKRTARAGIPGGCKGVRGVDESFHSFVAQSPDQHQPQTGSSAVGGAAVQTSSTNAIAAFRSRIIFQRASALRACVINAPAV